jgi:hypothetical protein
VWTQRFLIKFIFKNFKSLDGIYTNEKMNYKI